VTLVLSEALRMTMAGVVVGLAGALGLARLLRSQLLGVSPADPVTILTVPAILVAVAILAAWVPARRAMRVDAMVALRHE
jgi:putative ABC transport system permease protein